MTLIFWSLFFFNSNQHAPHKPGHNQSPVGNFATISNLPNLNENELMVCNLALRIGLIMFSGVPCLSQPNHSGFVQLKAKRFFDIIRAISYRHFISHGFSLIWPCFNPCSPITSTVSVGWMYSFPSLINELFGLATYHWNSQFYAFRKVGIYYFWDQIIHLFVIVLILTPPPPSVISCAQRLRLSSLKFSCKINWPEHKVPVGAFLPLTVVADRTHCDWIRSTKIGSSVTKITKNRP